MKTWKFELNQKVQLNSGEVGQVIGRAEFNFAEDSYQIRYVAGDKRQVEAWWTESAVFEYKG